MDRIEALTAYYSRGKEDGRLLSRYGSVEFITTVNYIEKYLREGVKIDGLGMQYHAYVSKETADIKLAEVCNPLRIIDVLDRYGDFKLPIHISEVSIPSYSNESYDEELQAELTERLFRLWFSSKYCESIVWWNLCDNTAYKTENIYHSGLLRYDCTEKPVYKVLNNLINKEWNTTFEETPLKNTSLRRNIFLRWSGLWWHLH